MCRFAITTDNNSFKKVVSHFEKQSLNEAVKIQDNISFFLGLINASKKFFFKKYKNDWLFIGGTYLVNSNIINVEDYIYSNFNEDLSVIREKIVGNYCVIIRKKSSLYIFVDNYGMYPIYYSNIASFVLTNSLFSISKTQSNLKVNENALLEVCFQHSTLDDQTFFKEIKQLKSDRLLKYEINNGRLIEIDFPLISSADSQITFDIQDVKRDFSLYATKIAKSFKKVAINMTGGLDSRLILASFLSIGCKPLLLYGKGESPITNTKNEDYEIVKIISEKFKLDLHLMDWSEDNDIHDDARILSLMYKYDEYFHIYGANSNILKEYSEIVPGKCDIIEFGYFGEMLRNLPWIEKTNQQKIHLDQILENYLHDDLNSYGVNPKNYQSYMYQKIQFILNKIGILKRDEMEIDINDYQKFHAVYRYSADTKMNSFNNAYNNSIILQGIPDIHNKVLSLLKTQKVNGIYIIKLIQLLLPELLDVPIFSHAQKWVLNSINGKLEPVIADSNFYDYFKNKYRNNIWIKQIYRFFASLFIYDRAKREMYYKSKKLREIYIPKINKLQNLLNIKLIEPEKYFGDIRSLIKYCHFLMMINESRKD